MIDAAVEAFIAQYAMDAKEVARQAHSDSPYFSPEDVENEIWLSFLSSPGMTSSWMKNESRMRSEGFTDKGVHTGVRRMMRRAANVYCEGQRIQYEYNSGNVIYSVELIKKGLDSLDWLSEDEVHCWRESDAPEIQTYGDKFMESMDLHKEVMKLNTPQRHALFKRHGLEEKLTKHENDMALKAYKKMGANLSHKTKQFRVTEEEV